MNYNTGSMYFKLLMPTHFSYTTFVLSVQRVGKFCERLTGLKIVYISSKVNYCKDTPKKREN